MKRRLVTVFGGSGFVGRHLVRRLAAEGWAVRVAVRDTVAAEFLKSAGQINQVVPFPCDIGDRDSVARALAGASAAVYLVGILSGRERDFQRCHAAGPRYVAEAARAAGVARLVHVSAIGAEAGATSLYARTKAEGEEAVRRVFTEATVLRPSVIFGPEDKFFNLFGSIARLSPLMPVPGGGATRLQPVYVGDVVAAILAALNDPSARGRVFELGGPRVLTLREILTTVLAVTRRKCLLVPWPLWLMGLEAWFLEKLPGRLMTRDQVRLLGSDNVVGSDAATLSDLGIAPTPLEAVLPHYLDRFRPPVRQSRRDRTV